MSHHFSLQHWLQSKPRLADAAAMLLLFVLWAFYFWRVLTPKEADQVSLPQGDYSGQFLAFGAYQSERMLAGEIPLWNPFSRGGHPFLADTQAAVFYPLRLITFVVSDMIGTGWNYAALQAETIIHYWLASLFMYLFARTATHSRIGGIVSSIIFTYGGYLTGYPPLQLAILEAAIWLPLALLGIHKATETQHARPKLAWLAFGAFAIGIGLLAGHPQTSLYSAYLCIAYIFYRILSNRINPVWLIPAVFIVIGLGFGTAAVQLLPGFEYTRLTTRSGYGYEQLANGFPLSDFISLLLPKVLSYWSPLYSGILTLILAAIAVWSHIRTSRFWAAVVIIGAGISLGRHAVAYALAYLAIPGFAMFRGQERAAFVIAIGIAILAGQGASSLISGRFTQIRSLSRHIGVAVTAIWGFAAILFIVERIIPREETYSALRAGVFLAIISTLAWAVIARGRLATTSGWRATMLGLVIFDLFTVTIGTNWEPLPAEDRDLLSDLVPPVLADESLYRVDGRLGLGENYGTMVGIQDIRGTSPLWLSTLEDYYLLPEARLYQLLSVKYVFTDWHELTVPSTILAEASDGSLPLYLHQLESPTPRAWMVYSVMDTPDRAQTLGWLADPSFNPLSTVILTAQPDLDLPALPPADTEVTVTDYRPERFEIAVNSAADGVLVISELDYPGWTASVDGTLTSILHANAGIRAVPLQAGKHSIVLEYKPMSFVQGITVSLVSIGMLLTITMVSLKRYYPLIGNE